MSDGGSFFRMAPNERRVLIFLILFAVVSFLPMWRGIQVAGMSVFGWLMAVLMVLSPILTLWVFHGNRR